MTDSSPVDFDRIIVPVFISTGEYRFSFFSWITFGHKKWTIPRLFVVLNSRNTAGDRLIPGYSVPVIVLTSDQASELDCLKTGAMDFIPKPYPDIEIVKARVSKCIELSEDRELIRYTERDKLTGLLNKDYFFRYVGRLDHLYRGTALDAVTCNVNRFHSVTKQYGRQFGDHVLRSIGAALRKLARETGGISCREEDDVFLLYCPHQDHYEQLISGFLSDALAGKEIADKVSVRFGIFADARQTEDIEERFERAKIAAERVKSDPERNCGFYDQA